ncbi:MAG: M20 family metallopeptidase [Bacteroidia bacterium]|nr:M20 family metallopeptidase [Bacteroidia bacterium]MDW8015315.1 M20 family metallopeptidase [Bacteroidia bacterium]
MSNLLEEARRYFPQLIAWRRHLHQYPEPSFEERATQAFLFSTLSSLPELRLKTAAQTGLIADLITNPKGPWIALRADMDALPIEEKSQHSYRSQNPGYMHACGHDAHMAILLGAIHLLWEQRTHWQGGIRFIFQPGEEKAPGGASLLIQEGILEEVPIQAIWALHVTPQLPVGTIGLRAGPFMAASDEIYIKLTGKGGHAAYPHLVGDPIAVGAYLITELQMVVSRATDPRSPTVLTFGCFHAGTAPNIIPTHADIAGTLRTFDEESRQYLKRLIHTVACHTAANWGLTAEVKWFSGYPVLINDRFLTTLTHQWASALIGSEKIQEVPLWLSSEDFAFYSQKVPACFIRLGTAGDSPQTHFPVHTPEFDISEEALVIGTALLTHLSLQALRFLGNPRSTFERPSSERE